LLPYVYVSQGWSNAERRVVSAYLAVGTAAGDCVGSVCGAGRSGVARGRLSRHVEFGLVWCSEVEAVEYGVLYLGSRLVVWSARVLAWKWVRGSI
jgi:hypothetical protein